MQIRGSPGTISSVVVVSSPENDPVVPSLVVVSLEVVVASLEVIVSCIEVVVSSLEVFVSSTEDVVGGGERIVIVGSYGECVDIV